MLSHQSSKLATLRVNVNLRLYIEFKPESPQEKDLLTIQERTCILSAISFGNDRFASKEGCTPGCYGAL